MIQIVITIAKLIADIKWIVKKLTGTDPRELERLRLEVKEAYKNAKENKDPSGIARIINGK